MQKQSFSQLGSKKAAQLAALQLRYKNLTQHPFADFTKTKIVFGTGNLDSPLLFLGEGPGRDEDLQGIPFVGRAGQLLTKMINAMGFAREQVYITNVIKCRLPNNRPPSDLEIEQEKNLILNEELQILRPKIICTLGSSATKAMLGLTTNISQVRGKIFDIEGYAIAPTYHPAYLLRNSSAKRFVWADLQQILALL